METGTYKRRLHLPTTTPSGKASIVEQRTYAHRSRMHIMVTEFELISGDEVELQLDNLFDPLCGPPPPPPDQPPTLMWNGSYLRVTDDSGSNGHDIGSLPACVSGGCPLNELKAACDKSPACDLFQTHGFLKSCPPGASTNKTTACREKTPWAGVDSYYKVKTFSEGNQMPMTQRSSRFGEGQPCASIGKGCAGTWNNNLPFKKLPSPPGEQWADVTVFCGGTCDPNLKGTSGTDGAVIVSRTVPATLKLSPGAIERFPAAITTTVGHESSYNPVLDATSEYAAATHPSNVSSLYNEHIVAWSSIWSQGGIEVLGIPDDVTGRALDIQSHLFSSMYYLITSIREDWPHGALNPGGLASDNYDTVFFDMEFYMEPAVLWWWPELAKAMTKFRFEGLAAAKTQAKVFGYAGAQFPWCAISFGRSAGCCSGTGGFELCLEQHITPDVGFAMQQYYRWTGDKEWLSEIGFPIAKAVAEWIVSRVRVDKAGIYHIDKVMPVDEWCHQPSGCADPGVNDDPQMNGASKVALRFAVEAAETLNNTIDPKWSEIAEKLYMPFGNFSTPYGSYHDVHLMPNGTVPFETYLSNGQGTVCPEDVMYL